MLQSSAEAIEMNRRRWQKPSFVDLRVDALIGRIRRTLNAMPPLTQAQRARLREVIDAQAGGETDD